MTWMADRMSAVTNVGVCAERKLRKAKIRMDGRHGGRLLPILWGFAQQNPMPKNDMDVIFGQRKG
jgi:hypothetical protein